jgi:hypothetical protein
MKKIKSDCFWNLILSQQHLGIKKMTLWMN